MVVVVVVVAVVRVENVWFGVRACMHGCADDMSLGMACCLCGWAWGMRALSRFAACSTERAHLCTRRAPGANSPLPACPAVLPPAHPAPPPPAPNLQRKVPHVLSLTDFIGWRYGWVAKSYVVLLCCFNMSIGARGEGGAGARGEGGARERRLLPGRGGLVRGGSCRGEGARGGAPILVRSCIKQKALPGAASKRSPAARCCAGPGPRRLPAAPPLFSLPRLPALASHFLASPP